MKLVIPPEPRALTKDQQYTVYIAGPMRGWPLLNFPMFDKARDSWLNSGWHVISPADIDRAVDKLDPTHPETVKNIGHYMRRDISALLHCGAIAFLPGWEQSEGSRIEYVVAKALGLALFDAITKGPLLGHIALTSVLPTRPPCAVSPSPSCLPCR